jgi:hypothetical protein
VEEQLPYFNDLEVRNQQLQMEVNSKKVRSQGNQSVKLRQVEERWQAKEVEWERERRKLSDEAKHLRERLEVLRGMNLNLQKLEGIQRRKAE